MSTSTRLHDPARASSAIEAVLQTVAYADIFDYPLTAEEVFTYLPAAADRDAVDAAIAALLAGGTGLATDGEYLFLPARENLPDVRRGRAPHAARAWKRARRYGKVFWALPFVRMVAVTGALAMDNIEPRDDIDFLIVTEPGRLWTVRGLIVLVCRGARLFGDTLCPNYLISTRALRLDGHDLYGAHELAQMVPLHGIEVTARLWEENPWCAAILPNARMRALRRRRGAPPPGLSTVKRLAEFLLRLPPGDWVEEWEQRRKIAKLSARVPPGVDEALYTADVCKGHDSGHGGRVMALLATRNPHPPAPSPSRGEGEHDDQALRFRRAVSQGSPPSPLEGIAER
jgi:hypothetical protein